MNRYTIRGATTVESNTYEEIKTKTVELLKDVLEKNKLEIDDIESIIFTCTEDIDAVYPAKFAREIGFTDASLLCMQEMKVANSLNYCIRILIFLKNNVKLKDVCNIYLHNAGNLRKDID